MESSEPLPEYLPGTPTLLKKNQSLNGREEATNSENILEEEEDENGSEKETDDEATDFVYNWVERSFSPVSSVLSMQTSHSNHHDHPNLRTQPMESRYQPRLLETCAHPQYRDTVGDLSSFREETCDVCSDGRVRAVKVCLTCSASYCEAHIRHHYTTDELQEHKLVDITGSEVAKHLSVSMETAQGETQSSVTDAQAWHQNSWKQGWKTGRRPAGKSATGNTILGTCEVKGGVLPALATPEYSKKVREMLKEMIRAEVSEREMRSEEERKREEAERLIREEEREKREELERNIRAEEDKKREQAEREIREEEKKKMEQAERDIKTQSRRMRINTQVSFLRNYFNLPGMLNLLDGENKLYESEREITAWQQMQRRQTERETREWRETQRLELEREIRAEMVKQREEFERKIREEEREKREEQERRIRAEMAKQRDEIERKIREEESEKREELERRIRAEMAKQRDEFERIREEETKKREELERRIIAEPKIKEDQTKEMIEPEVQRQRENTERNQRRCIIL